MAKASYDELEQLCREMMDYCVPSSWAPQVEAKVRQFVEFRPELFPLEILGRVVATVRDYTGKIQLLESTFQLTTRERKKQDDAYRKYLKQRTVAVNAKNRARWADSK